MDRALEIGHGPHLLELVDHHHDRPGLIRARLVQSDRGNEVGEHQAQKWREGCDVILRDRDIERLRLLPEGREIKVAGLRGRAHRRVVPLLETGGHQRLDVRGQQPR